MMKIKDMSGWIITLLIVLIIVGGGLAVKFWPRTVPLEECSPVYRKYVDVPGVNASFIKNYWLNDTVSSDATLLVFTDTALLIQVRNGIFDKMSAYYDSVGYYPEHFAWTVFKNREDYRQPEDRQNKFNNDIVFYCSSHPQSIAIFHIATEEQINTIIDYKFEFMNKQKNNLQQQ